MVTGRHGEGYEARDELERLSRELVADLASRGFFAESVEVDVDGRGPAVPVEVLVGGEESSEAEEAEEAGSAGAESSDGGEELTLLERIEAIRAERQVSQAGLAEELGVSRYAIKKALAGA